MTGQDIIMIEVNVKFPKRHIFKKPAIEERIHINLLDSDNNLLDEINKMIVIYIDPSLFKEPKARKKFRAKYSFYPLDIDWIFVSKSSKYFDYLDDNKLYILKKADDKYFIEITEDPDLYDIVYKYYSVDEASEYLRANFGII